MEFVWADSLISQLLLTYLTTRLEGDIVRGQLSFLVDSAELLMRGGMAGGILREGEGREGRAVGKEEGGEICDGRRADEQVCK